VGFATGHVILLLNKRTLWVLNLLLGCSLEAVMLAPASGWMDLLTALRQSLNRSSKSF